MNGAQGSGVTFKSAEGGATDVTAESVRANSVVAQGATVSGVVSIEGTSDPNVLAARSGMKLWVRVETPPGAASRRR